MPGKAFNPNMDMVGFMAGQYGDKHEGSGIVIDVDENFQTGEVPNVHEKRTLTSMAKELDVAEPSLSLGSKASNAIGSGKLQDVSDKLFQKLKNVKEKAGKIIGDAGKGTAKLAIGAIGVETLRQFIEKPELMAAVVAEEVGDKVTRGPWGTIASMILEPMQGPKELVDEKTGMTYTEDQPAPSTYMSEEEIKKSAIMDKSYNLPFAQQQALMRHETWRSVHSKLPKNQEVLNESVTPDTRIDNDSFLNMQTN